MGRRDNLKGQPDKKDQKDQKEQQGQPAEGGTPFTVSVIFIARQQSECDAALAQLEHLDVPSPEIEIILALGTNPSEQRNRAAALAQGGYLLFLDNDSMVDPKLLVHYREALSCENAIAVVGGPAVYQSQGNAFSVALQSVFSSSFGVGPFRARYSSIGAVRRTDERELILCNLLIERKFFLAENGFSKELYPNEENEFMHRIGARAKIYYHPAAVCYRPSMSSFLEVSQKIFGYGEGRFKQFVFQKSWSFIFLIPTLFVLYLMFLGLSLCFEPSPWGAVIFYPLAVYLVCLVLASLVAVVRNQKPVTWFYVLSLFFIGHCFYGMGFLWGLVNLPFNRARGVGEIEVLVIKKFSQVRSVQYG